MWITLAKGFDYIMRIDLEGWSQSGTKRVAARTNIHPVRNIASFAPGRIFYLSFDTGIAFGG